jgi:hypothetical protein
MFANILKNKLDNKKKLMKIINSYLYDKLDNKKKLMKIINSYLYDNVCAKQTKTSSYKHLHEMKKNLEEYEHLCKIKKKLEEYEHLCKIKKKLAEYIFDFVLNSVVGFERAFYQNRNILNINLQDESNNNILPAIAHKEYYNKLYKSLILKNDKYVTTKFKQMKDVLDHSYICLLNLCFHISMSVHKSINRKILNVSSLDNYGMSIYYQINEYKEKIIDIIVQLINHKCVGDDIEKHNPDDEFVFSTVHEKE